MLTPDQNGSWTWVAQRRACVRVAAGEREGGPGAGQPGASAGP